MDRLGIILDATHLCDESFWEALEHFHGPVWASHSNCRALVPDTRQFTDEQLKALIERGAVIGGGARRLDARARLDPGRDHAARAGVKLDHMVDHIDHVCQLPATRATSAIGTDLDGGFGREQGPRTSTPSPTSSACPSC